MTKKRADWIKIKNYYISHEVSLEELAKKYGVGISATKKHSREEKWGEIKAEKRAEIDRRVTEKIVEKEVNRKTRANEFHTELYDKGLEVANLLLDRYLKELKSGKKRNLKANAYNLDFVMKAIANAQKGQRLSLNIEAEETESEPEILIIEGISEDDI